MSGIDLRLARRVASAPASAIYATVDGLLVAAAYVVVLLVRHDGAIPADRWADLRAFLPVALVLHLGVHAAFRLYRSLWRFASVDEARRLLAAGACSTVAAVVASSALGALPVLVAAAGGAVATVLIGASRFRARLFASRRDGAKGTDRSRVVVVGAGEAGAAIVRSMRAGARRHAVAVLDDDPRTWGRDLLGVPVRGAVAELPAVVDELAADEVVLAVAGADRDLVRRVADGAEVGAVPLRVVPPLTDLVDQRLTIDDVRDLQVDDLLRRRPVDTDLDAARSVLADRVVLITGAGGSIGSEIARQVMACRPQAAILVDHDETHLHDLTSTLRGPIEAALADVRDREVMADLLRDVRPDVVFHAAALKHVPILERHACEAIRTNVFGTANVIDAARAAGAERFVLVSTDKAVRPSSVMGASKWLAERLVLSAGHDGFTACAVRFGNVLGSRGSVAPTFVRQINAGGPVTVTDPRMTRFFMSIEEAVHLVLISSAVASQGDILMLDMGEAVPILELAERLIRLSGRRPGTDIELRVTGVRPGEKLEEELQAPDEATEATVHPSITRLRSAPVDRTQLRAVLGALSDLVERRDQAATARQLRAAATAGLSAALPDEIDLRPIAEVRA